MLDPRCFLFNLPEMRLFENQIDTISGYPASVPKQVRLENEFEILEIALVCQQAPWPGSTSPFPSIMFLWFYSYF